MIETSKPRSSDQGFKVGQHYAIQNLEKGQGHCCIETVIVWKYSPKLFTYLRESTYWTMRPTGPVHGWSGSRGIFVRTLEKLKAAADG